MSLGCRYNRLWTPWMTLSIALEVSRAANSRRAREPPDERHGPKSHSRPPETAAPEFADHLEAPQSPRTRVRASPIAKRTVSEDSTRPAFSSADSAPEDEGATGRGLAPCSI